MTQSIVSRVVIGLADSERLEGFFAQPRSELFEHFVGIDNRDGAFIGDFDVEEFRDFFGRSPRVGEIGCTLSHVEVMRRFAAAAGDGADLILIAEDDARFSPHLEDVLRAVQDMDTTIDIVNLGDPYGLADVRDRRTGSASEHFVQLSLFSRRIRAKDRRAPYWIGRWASGLTGAGLYLVSRESCRRVVEYLEAEPGRKPWWVADYYGFFRDDLHCDVLFVRPNLASWVGNSSIQDVDHVEWRAASGRPSARQPDLRAWAAEQGHRAKLMAKSTVFDLRWRQRSR